MMNKRKSENNLNSKCRFLACIQMEFPIII